MNYGTSSGASGLSSFETSARRAMVPASTRRSRATTNGLGYTPDDGDLMMGSIFGKTIDKLFEKPLGSSSSIANQIFRVATYPVRVAGAITLQTVGLKNLASQVGGKMISKNLLTSIGQVSQVAAVVAGAVIAAPIVGSAIGIGGAGTGVAATGVAATGAGAAAATGVSAAAVGASAAVAGGTGILGGISAAASAVGAAAAIIPAKEAKAQAESAAPAEVQVDGQAFYDAGVADAQANRSRVTQSNPVADQFYVQGYSDAVTVMLATSQEAKATGKDVAQAMSGNSLTGTSTSISDSAAALMAGSGITKENINKIASIAIPLILIGFIFSTRKPANG